MELDHDRGVIVQPLGARRQKSPVRPQPVPRSEHRALGLIRKVWIARRIGKSEVRKVRDDDVDRIRNRLEEVTVADNHPTPDAVTLCVRARERDGVAAAVRRPDLG